MTDRGAPPGSGDRRQPFGSIGLSLSGGGFRATAFHLGTLDTLHRLGLSDDVTVLSTVSGGTFTGAGFALATARGVGFEQFFRDLYSVLERNDLPARAMSALRRGPPQTPARTRKLITAAAEAYDSGWLDGARFGELLESRTHLREIILNATEFRHGLPFRFRASHSPRVRIGNQKTSIPRSAAAGLRLADIVAASSCFPGGFEPMALPDDFCWPDACLPEELEGFETVALMDGGITDNQGVGSVRLADQTRGVDLGLIIISDTDRATERLFDPTAAPAAGGARLWLVAAGLALVTTGLAASGASLVAEAIRVTLERGPLWSEDPLLLWMPGLACSAAAVGAVALAVVALRRLSTRLPRPLRHPFLTTLGNLGLYEAAHLLRVRLRSLAALTSHVFTRRIRRQVFETAYEDELYRDRLVANLIYRLPRHRELEPRPSTTLLDVADLASRMPTTLWFEDPEQLPTLVACGQATLCHALLGHIERLDDPDDDVARVADQARRLWDRINDTPLDLGRERLEGESSASS